ncbi:MAG TPA: hypothetical protein VLM76_11655 [Patescibacteria group bacterium]|nr:hypothetical protein [Patescibacteria group bacterium]
MSSRVNIPVGVADNASGPIDRIRDRFDTLGKSGGVKSFATGLGMGAGIGVFNLATSAVHGVAAALGGMVTGAVSDAESVGRLQQTLDNSIPSWRESAAVIDERILAGQKLAFSDDQMRDSLAALATRTKDTAQAMDLQTIAMDLARAKGIDLTTAANLVGRVYSGNVGILNRYGIAVEKGASSTEALAAIQQMSAGQAERFGASTKGSMESIGVAMSEVGESLGAALMPALQALVPIIRDKIVPIIQVFATLLGTVLQALSPLVGFIADVAITAFQGLAALVLTAGEALLSVAAAIPGPWQEGAATMRTALGEMKDDLLNLTGSATSIAADVGPQVGGALAAGSGDVAEGAEEGFAPIPEEAGKAGEAAQLSLAGSLVAMIDDVRNSQDEFVAAWKAVLDASAKEQDLGLALVKSTSEQKAQAAILADEKATEAQKAQAAERLADLERAHAELLAEQATYGTLSEQITRTNALLTSEALVEGLRAGDDAVAEYWSRLRDITVTRLQELQADAREHGADVGSAFGEGLGSERALAAVTGAAGKIAHRMSALFEGQSPPREGPLREIDEWGGGVGRAFLGGFSAAIAEHAQAPAPRGLLPALAPAGGGPAAAIAGALGGGQPTATVVNATVNVTGPTLDPYGDFAQRLAAALIPGLQRELARQGINL